MLSCALGNLAASDWLVRAVRAVALVLAAVALAGCGEAKPAAQAPQRILTVSRVEAQKSDGTWAPVANAKVHYEIYGKPVGGLNVPMYQQYDDVTDENGFSAVWRDTEGKTDHDITVVFMEVELPDGRTGFKRPNTEVKFDFLRWLETFLPAPVEKDAAVKVICDTIGDYPNCANVLKSDGLKTWGTAQLVRIS